MSSTRIGKPVHLDAEFGQGLFDDPSLAVVSFDKNGPVGDAAIQHGQSWSFARFQMPLLVQVLQERLGLFDIKARGHSVNLLERIVASSSQR